MSWLLRALDPRVERYLLAEEGERVIDEVKRHPMAGLLPAVRLGLGTWLLGFAFAFSSAVFWVLLSGALALIAQALWRMAEEYRDRFVITNQKVYRVHGNLDQQRASMPLNRILDITVDRPFVGRIFNYGHFVFESAAQDQGLRDIRFVPDIDRRERLIQKVIKRAGLRSTMAMDEDDGT